VQVPAKDQIAALKHNLALYNKNQERCKGQIFCPDLFLFFPENLPLKVYLYLYL